MKCLNKARYASEILIVLTLTGCSGRQTAITTVANSMTKQDENDIITALAKPIITAVISSSLTSLTVKGSYLQNVNKVTLNSQDLTISNKQPNQLLLTALKPIALVASGLYNLVITNAMGDTSSQLLFDLSQLEISDSTKVPQLTIRNSSSTDTNGPILNFKSNFSYLAEANKIAAQLIGEPDNTSGGRLIVKTSNTRGVLTEAMRLDTDGNMTVAGNLKVNGSIAGGTGLTGCRQVKESSNGGGTQSVKCNPDEMMISATTQCLYGIDTPLPVANIPLAIQYSFDSTKKTYYQYASYRCMDNADLYRYYDRGSLYNGFTAAICCKL